LYFKYLLRGPDAAGLSHWVSQVRSGSSLSAVDGYFSSSAEARNLRATMAKLSKTEFVDRLYL